MVAAGFPLTSHRCSGVLPGWSHCCHSGHYIVALKGGNVKRGDYTEALVETQADAVTEAAIPTISVGTILNMSHLMGAYGIIFIPVNVLANLDFKKQ